MKLAPGQSHASWRVYRRMFDASNARGKPFAIDDLDGVRAAYAAAYEEAVASGSDYIGDYPAVARVWIQGRLNGKGNWRRQTRVHIERVGTNIDDPALSSFDLTLSLDLTDGPAAASGYDLPRYARTGELHMLDADA